MIQTVSKLHPHFYRFRLPSKNFSKPLSVDIELVFHSINDISEINQAMSSSGKLKLKWNDEYLTWNKSHFNYIDRLLVAGKT
jgi:hypothetical protein